MIHKERKEIYSKVFDTVEGKQVIEDLCNQHYISKSTYNREGSIYETMMREGERRVVLRILRILEKKEKD